MRFWTCVSWQIAPCVRCRKQISRAATHATTEARHGRIKRVSAHNRGARYCSTSLNIQSGAEVSDMTYTRNAKGIFWALTAAVSVSAGCSTSAPQQSEPISAVEEAVTLFDCQSQAVQCLGNMPAPDKIASCRTDLVTCIGDVQKDLQAEDQSIATCRMDAGKCAQAARSGSDAMKCRSDLQSCIGAAVQAPMGGAGGANSEAGAGGAGPLETLAACRTTALECVRAAKTPADMATCRTDFAKCAPRVTPPLAGAGGELGKAQGCRADALSCVSKAKTPEEAATCRTNYRACVGLPTAPPARTPPTGAAGRGQFELPSLPTTGAAGRGQFELPSFPRAGTNG
jgi:hypothetical protein